MKKINIFLYIIIYMIFIIFYFYLDIEMMWHRSFSESIIFYYSRILYDMFKLIPIFTFLMPIIFRNNRNKALMFSIIQVILYIPMLITTRYILKNYLTEFTQEKWNKTNYEIREYMIDSFEKKYKPIGKDTDYIVQVLGRDYDNEFVHMIHEKSIHYGIGYSFNKPKYYCLDYDADNKIVNIRICYR